jgi:ribosomal protein S18 acetylase RimI-like enzyme
LTPSSKITITEATTESQIADVRELFLEYGGSIEISLCFQNFEEELAALPGKYAPPTGRLLLAREAAQSAGCVAIRELDPGVCEMKRLYVRPAWRGKGLGRTLALAVIGAARHIGYDRMRLDTLGSMKPAISLYHSLGFKTIPAYYSNPSESAVFMELKLFT